MTDIGIQTLETERLLLRKLRRDDTRCYFERLGSSAAVTEFMLWNPHRDLSESVASIEKALSRYEAGGCYRWAIALKEEDDLIGVIELLRFNDEENSCSFAYMLCEDFWDRGYATEALKAVLDFAFMQLNIAVVEVDHFVENAASGAVMRKAGMQYQRTDFDKYEKNGKHHDADVYRITRSQWKSQIS